MAETVLLSPPDPGQTYTDRNSNVYRGDPIDVPLDMVDYMKDVHGFTEWDGRTEPVMDGPPQAEATARPVSKKASK